MKKIVMSKAWEIARAAVVKFGGKATQYISEALKTAWFEVKNMKPNKKAMRRYQQSLRPQLTQAQMDKDTANTFWNQYKLFKNNGGRREFLMNNNTLVQLMSNWTDERFNEVFGKYADFVAKYIFA